MTRRARPFRSALLAAAAATIVGAGAGAVEPLAARARTDRGELQVAVRAAPGGARFELRLARPDGSLIELPEPGPHVAPRLDEPTPVLVSGALSGLAWLEGETRESYAVRYSPWTGAGWGPVEAVAAPGPGSQLALGALAMGDGRLLLVWAGYDGEDDEILYALRGPDGRWSAPARVAEDNSVPDITPAVAAGAGAEGGALVAWSRYDAGQYRIALARFDGERFRPARLVGRPGTLFPSFEAPGPAGEPRLLYRNARPPGWTLAELDRSGAVTHQYSVAARDERRPTSVRVSEGRLQLRFDAAPGGGSRP